MRSLLFIMMVLLLSCTKEKEDEQYLKFKVDGVAINATENAFANKPAQFGDGIIISSFWQGGSIQLEIMDTDGAKVYPVSSTTRISYSENNNPYYAGDFMGSPVRGSGKITITELTPDYVKGSFEGQLPASAPGMATKIISEGQFSLKRK
jgi:hypothetical protein